jgi:hypothetical protein
VDPSHSLWREGEVGATSIALNQEKISKSRQGEKNYPISKIIVGGTDDVLTSHYTVVQDQMSGGIVTFTLDLETIEKALIENGHHEKDVLTESLSEFSGCVQGAGVGVFGEMSHPEGSCEMWLCSHVPQFGWLKNNLKFRIFFYIQVLE